MKRTNYMKTSDFIHATISHNIKDPHSKALEPDCLSPLLAIATQSPREGREFKPPLPLVGEGRVRGLRYQLIYSFSYKLQEAVSRL